MYRKRLKSVWLLFLVLSAFVLCAKGEETEVVSTSDVDKLLNRSPFGSLLDRLLKASLDGDYALIHQMLHPRFREAISIDHFGKKLGDSKFSFTELHIISSQQFDETAYAVVSSRRAKMGQKTHSIDVVFLEFDSTNNEWKLVNFPWGFPLFPIFGEVPDCFVDGFFSNR